MANHMRAEFVNQALSMALCQRQPAAGLIMHMDRGSQYGADSYRQLLAQHGMPPSMGRKGNCGDKAVAESFCHTLQTVLISLEDYDTHEAVQTAVFEYVVAYKSAHLDGAASEKVVHSSHSTQSEPETIHEVWRILHEHVAGTADKSGTPVAPGP